MEQPTAVLEHLALQQIRAGQLEAATLLYRQAVSQGEASAAAYINLAALELKANHIEAAEELLQEALRLSPNNAEAWLNLGTVQHGLGRSHQAAESFRKAAALKPGFAKAYANLGHALQASEAFEAALEAYQEALRYQPNYPEVLSGQGVALREIGRTRASIESLQRSLALRSNYPEAMNNLGLSLQEAGQIEEATHWFEQALAISPKQPEIISNLALALMEQGQIDQATDQLQQALKINPLYAEAHRHLAYCVNGLKNQQPEQAARACLDALQDRHKSYHLHFAIGKYKLDRHESDAADWFCNANRLRAEQLAGRWTIPDLNRLLAFNQSVLESEDRAPTNNQPSATEPTLIFIVGLPRSGSTLVETILSQNRSLIDLGEVPYLDQALANNGSIRQIHSHYFNSVHQHPAFTEKTEALTDKFLYNFAYCPILARAFPHCRILHVARNPMDNLWSTFTNHFAKGNEWTYNLEHSVAFYHLYRQVMASHEKSIPGRIYHLNYDQLTRAPERVIPELIHFCGFEWDSTYLHPECSQRQIHTASAVQARAPINSRSVGRWRHYRDLLQPYADQLEQLGYSTEIEPVA